MREYKKKIETTNYLQDYAHCLGFEKKVCETCFRKYLSESLEKLGIHRVSSIKPVILNDEDCMMFVDIKDCKNEVHELQKRIAIYEDEMMNEV